MCLANSYLIILWNFFLLLSLRSNNTFDKITSKILATQTLSATIYSIQLRWYERYSIWPSIVAVFCSLPEFPQAR